MSESAKTFEELAPDEKKIFSDALKVYLGYEDDIKDTRTSQKAQITICASKIDGLSKKDIRKMFTYFKKGVTAEQLREDAESMDTIKSTMDATSMME